MKILYILFSIVGSIILFISISYAIGYSLSLGFGYYLLLLLFAVIIYLINQEIQLKKIRKSQAEEHKKE